MPTDIAIPETTQLQHLPGPELASLFDSRVGSALSGQERAKLAALLAANDRLDVAIPDDIDAGELWQTLSLCCRVLRGTRQAGAQLKLLIGRALVLMKANPETIINLGFRSFDEFMTDMERGLPALVNVSRPELYKALSVAKKFPSMSMDQYQRIGSFNKLAAIAQVTDEKSSDSDDWLEKAETQTLDDLKKDIYATRHIDEGALDLEVFQITVAGDEKTRIEEFLADPEMQAYTETRAPGAMLVRAIEEATTEWAAQGEKGRD